MPIIFVLIVCFVVAFASPGFAQTVDARWIVTKFAGEAWFAKPKSLIGKSQDIRKGYAQGVFFSCDFEGQSMTYHSYDMAEFLANKEFDVFAKLRSELGFKGKTVFVHRITCNGKTAKTRRVLYPFVTVEPGKKAYYLYEGAIYQLKRR
jgi:hypothetical protein